MITSRRSLLTGLATAFAAPVLVKVEALMSCRGKRLLLEPTTVYVRSWGADPRTPLPSSYEAFRTIWSALDYLNDKIDCNKQHVTIDVSAGFYRENINLACVDTTELTLRLNRGAYLMGETHEPGKICWGPDDFRA